MKFKYNIKYLKLLFLISFIGFLIYLCLIKYGIILHKYLEQYDNFCPEYHRKLKPKCHWNHLQNTCNCIGYKSGQQILSSNNCCDDDCNALSKNQCDESYFNDKNITYYCQDSANNTCNKFTLQSGNIGEITCGKDDMTGRLNNVYDTENECLDNLDICRSFVSKKECIANNSTHKCGYCKEDIYRRCLEGDLRPFDTNYNCTGSNFIF